MAVEHLLSARYGSNRTVCGSVSLKNLNDCVTSEFGPLNVDLAERREWPLARDVFFLSVGDVDLPLSTAGYPSRSSSVTAPIQLAHIAAKSLRNARERSRDQVAPHPPSRGDRRSSRTLMGFDSYVNLNLRDEFPASSM
jgi:hypothetical protein